MQGDIMHKSLPLTAIIAGSLFLLTGCGVSHSANNQSSSASNSANSSKSSSTHTNSSNVTAPTSSSQQVNATSSASSSAQPNHQSVALSEAQQAQITAQFLAWAGQRARIGGMAVTDDYMDHGAAGFGDFFAATPDGLVQVQNQNNPGPNHFKIHAIGGVAFYTPIDGNLGVQTDLKGDFAEGYRVVARPDKPISKYLLGDNGTVYELQKPGDQVALSTGLGEFNDDGSYTSDNAVAPQDQFSISGDTAAQQELQKLLAPYRK
ncbi:hypothetical protein KAR53_09240 [Periweissella ghanensis]|nr:hypothetical protein [Periweissella ghanensis]